VWTTRVGLFGLCCVDAINFITVPTHLNLGYGIVRNLIMILNS
jgi:hypothetical protein